MERVEHLVHGVGRVSVDSVQLKRFVPVMVDDVQMVRPPAAAEADIAGLPVQPVVSQEEGAVDRETLSLVDRRRIGVRDMAETTGAPPEVVQAHRFELLDRHGQVRVVIGEQPNYVKDGELIIGVCLLDTEGKHRASLTLGDEGPSLSFDYRENNVLQLGVNDPVGDALKPGAYGFAADGNGAPVLHFHVSPDGKVEVEAAG